MNYILFDSCWEDMKPLTFTRPVAELRVGILTIIEKWNYYLHSTCSYKTKQYLSTKFPIYVENVNILVNGSVLPSKDIAAEISTLEHGEALKCNDELIAVCISRDEVETFSPEKYLENATELDVDSINYPWDIFTKNAEQIEADFKIVTKNKTSQPISQTNQVICPENIFIEEGAVVECATINAKGGKVYIGADAEVMECAVIRGPFALCEHATVKMSAKIYEGTTIGPFSKVGGEVQNSVLQGFSNKGHDGYLGNSVLGEWCNLGADTNNSNLKNDYSPVRVWNYPTERFFKTGLQFCGLIMGDHSKSAINTMFNTGTVAGVSANIFGAGFPRNFIPSFSWGGLQGIEEYALKRAIAVAERVYARRGKEFDKVEQDIFEHIFNETAQYRRF